MPLFFLSGVSWPFEEIPPVIHALSLLFPSTTAITAIVQVNQMGADYQDVLPTVYTPTWFNRVLFSTFRRHWGSQAAPVMFYKFRLLPAQTLNSACEHPSPMAKTVGQGIFEGHKYDAVQARARALSSGREEGAASLWESRTLKQRH